MLDIYGGNGSLCIGLSTEKLLVHRLGPLQHLNNLFVIRPTQPPTLSYTENEK